MKMLRSVLGGLVVAGLATPVRVQLHRGEDGGFIKLNDACAQTDNPANPSSCKSMYNYDCLISGFPIQHQECDPSDCS